MTYNTPVSYTHLDVYKRQVKTLKIKTDVWITIELSSNCDPTSTRENSCFVSNSATIYLAVLPLVGIQINFTVKKRFEFTSKLHHPLTQFCQKVITCRFDPTPRVHTNPAYRPPTSCPCLLYTSRCV